MNKRSVNVILSVGCWVFSAILLVLALIRLPAFFVERSRMQGLQLQLSNQLAIEAKYKAFRESFSAQAENIKTELKARQDKLNSAGFACLSADQITRFVDELQKLFASSGISLEKLAYKTREVKGDFIILPFEAAVLCSFKGMRSLLHGLETHRAGIRIEQLEFTNLNFKDLGARLQLSCIVRFKKLGS